MLKYILSILILVLSLNSLNAQDEFKPWKVDVGILLGEIVEHDVGVLFPYVEPKYNITDKVSAGLRSEFIIFSNEGFFGDDPNNPHWNNVDADGSVFSLALTADKYFTNNTVRPFVGMGAGYYYLKVRGKNNFLNLSENLHTSGIITRAGFNLGHFRISGEYNYVFSAKVNVNYFSLKLGYELGGGRKRFW